MKIMTIQIDLTGISVTIEMIIRINKMMMMMMTILMIVLLLMMIIIRINMMMMNDVIDD